MSTHKVFYKKTVIKKIKKQNIRNIQRKMKEW